MIAIITITRYPTKTCMGQPSGTFIAKNCFSTNSDDAGRRLHRRRKTSGCGERDPNPKPAWPQRFLYIRIRLILVPFVPSKVFWSSPCRQSRRQYRGLPVFSNIYWLCHQSWCHIGTHQLRKRFHNLAEGTPEKACNHPLVYKRLPKIYSSHQNKDRNTSAASLDTIQRCLSQQSFHVDGMVVYTIND